jgi:hypothetical protein
LSKATSQTRAPLSIFIDDDWAPQQVNALSFMPREFVSVLREPHSQRDLFGRASNPTCWVGPCSWQRQGGCERSNGRDETVAGAVIALKWFRWQIVSDGVGAAEVAREQSAGSEEGDCQWIRRVTPLSDLTLHEPTERLEYVVLGPRLEVMRQMGRIAAEAAHEPQSLEPERIQSFGAFRRLGHERSLSRR